VSGKGDRYRPVDREKFDRNWDRIFNKMPKPPHKGESQSSFMRRCVPIVKAEGKTKEKAVSICNGMWYSAHPSKKRIKKAYN
jgi:hypothetical protein